MFIKAIIIRGFKSYKVVLVLSEMFFAVMHVCVLHRQDEVKMEDLSRKHNAIVGRNGTGKSNFFDGARGVAECRAVSPLSSERVLRAFRWVLQLRLRRALDI
jgi:hypothetical protein